MDRDKQEPEAVSHFPLVEIVSAFECNWLLPAFEPWLAWGIAYGCHIYCGFKSDLKSLLFKLSGRCYFYHHSQAWLLCVWLLKSLLSSLLRSEMVCLLNLYLYIVWGLERNTSSVTQSPEKYTYLIFHPTPCSSNKGLCMSGVIKRTSSVWVSSGSGWCTPYQELPMYVLWSFTDGARVAHKPIFVPSVCCRLTIHDWVSVTNNFYISIRLGI